MPEAGGEYAYLTAAYGPFFGFLYAWTQTWVAKSASIAALATAFYSYLADFLPSLQTPLYVIPWPIGPGGGPLEIRYGQLLAIGLILFLSAVNYRGVQAGGRVQVAVTALKVILIAGVIAAGLLSREAHAANPPAPRRRSRGVAGFLCALVAACGLMMAGITLDARARKSKTRNGRSIGADCRRWSHHWSLSADQSRVFFRSERRRGCLQRSQRSRYDAADCRSPEWGRCRQRGRHDFHLCALKWFDLIGLQGALRDGKDGYFFRKIGHVHPVYQDLCQQHSASGSVAFSYLLSGRYS
jgi:hypothetical protein